VQRRKGAHYEVQLIGGLHNYILLTLMSYPINFLFFENVFKFFAFSFLNSLHIICSTPLQNNNDNNAINLENINLNK